jgi:biofilm PGA synthesis N-glycosyltransferase PgaC
MIFEVTFFVVYGVLLVAIAVAGYFIQRMKEGGYRGDDSDHIHLDSVVAIIPFRNEEDRIEGLLKSINQLNYFPGEFIFVNDHSDDNSVEKLNGLNDNIPYRILNLPEGQKGKKQAIRYAIENSASEYILTLDADIELPADYFLNLARLSNADMYWKHLFEVDLLLVNALNCGLSGWLRPIIASGANLMFKREAFERCDRWESHSHMPSGDDIYLLRDFRKGKAKIRLMTDPSLAIHTETPQSLKEFFNQRLRWIAKTGDVKDHLSTFLAILQAVLTFVFLFLVIRSGVKHDWDFFTNLLIVKTLIDMLVFMVFFNRSRRLRSWFFIPLYEIIYPFYLLTMLGMIYFFKPEWRGRKLERNY